MLICAGVFVFFGIIKPRIEEEKYKEEIRQEEEIDKDSESDAAKDREEEKDDKANDSEKTEESSETQDDHTEEITGQTEDNTIEAAAEEVIPNPLNAEFRIDPNTIEDYAANLDKNAFGCFDSGIADFNFRYPLYIYNDVTKYEEPIQNDYGTNVVTYSFSGSKGSRLVYMLTKREDSRSIKEMSKYVYSNETGKLIDSADIVNSVSGDHGKVIVTGWEDRSKDYIIYDMVKIEEDYVMQMVVIMTDFTDEIDKNEKSYITECNYRYCGFSDSKYSARTYAEYLDANK